MFKIVLRIFSVGLFCTAIAAHATFAWKTRVDEYLAPFFIARKNSKPVANIKQVLLPNCVSMTVQLYEKKSAQLLAMVNRIDQQLEFLNYRKKHSVLGRFYQLPTKWFKIMSDDQFQENINELRMLKKKYITLLGSLSNVMQVFPNDNSPQLVSAWVSSVLCLIIGEPIAAIEKFDQLSAMEDRAKKSMIHEQNFVVSVTGDAVVSSRIETSMTWMRRTATLAGIVLATRYAYLYGRAIADTAQRDQAALAQEEAAAQAQNLARSSAQQPAASHASSSSSASSDGMVALDDDTQAGVDAIGDSWTIFNVSGQMSRVLGLVFSEIKKINMTAKEFKNEIIDEAEARIHTAIKATRKQLEDFSTEQFNRYSRRSTYEMQRIKGGLYANASLVSGAGIAYWYVKRAISKHGAIYTAMKRNFQDMVYILSAQQTQFLSPEDLGNLIYIAKQLREYASAVLSYDELHLLGRDLQHITDPSITTMSKLETLKFMQKSYSFLAQKQAIII